MLTETDIYKLLNDLCVQFGLCLSGDEMKRLADSPPTDERSFADAVLAAEGMDPDAADRHLYRQVRDRIAETFKHAHHG
jgi:hypothetical protein